MDDILRLFGNRRYAAHFEFSDKARKELGVVEQLFHWLDNEKKSNFVNLRSSEYDPPDCICNDQYGNLVGIEVVEVVSEEAVKRNAKGEDVMRIWEQGDISSHIASLLKKKDAKKYIGGPYQEIVVCLFTNELMLTYEDAYEELLEYSFAPLAQITSAYLVFSYDPAIGMYPVLKLKTT